MKKMILVPALMLGTLAMATEYNYEVTPLIGYNIAEGNIELDDYGVVGAEVQYNGLDSGLKPELSVFYSKADYNTIDEDTDVYRFALNGVYEFEKQGPITPLAKVGLGYESMNDGSYTARTGNTASAFVDAGVGVKIPLAEAIALKLEGVYMLKHNNARNDSNLMILAGINFAFGEKAQKAAPVKEEPVVVPVVVDGDDDEDGVLNSIDKCPTTVAGKTVNAEGCFIDGDDDNDGILNSSDSCLDSGAGEEVDSSGCKVDGDDDQDGVLNSKDKCPDTPLNAVVNSDGCIKVVSLNVEFKNNSDIVNKGSYEIVDKYADFLNKYTMYDAKIIGYTDSRGRSAYNQKLSLKRANSIKEMLLQRGVDASRLTAIGMGEQDPIADNETSQGRAKNRRIESQLTKR
ncbi:MAG: OmpA family protein [Sulfurimonas sp.]|nr:OmpA family protein [Sulfurimonas sp.]